MTSKRTYSTSVMGGAISGIGGFIANKIPIEFLSITLFVLAFFVPIFYLVIDVMSFKGRFKKNGIKALIFPCNKDECIVVLRLIIWFVCTGVIITIADKIF